MNPYTKEIVRFYDIIVHGKEEVEAGKVELKFIEWAFKKVCPRNVNRILDVGCGNGRFLIPLIRKGYTVTGLDISEDMLEECHRRLKKQKLTADLVCKDLEVMDFDSEYDAVICMDSVICYILESEKIIDALKTFRRALRPQGILILENWNMLAQWKLFGKTHSYVYNQKGTNLEWQERDWYDTFASIYHIEVKGTVTEEGKSRKFRYEEILRATTIGEMYMYLKDAGFAEWFAYPDFDLSKVDRVDGDVMVFLAIP